MNNNRNIKFKLEIDKSKIGTFKLKDFKKFRELVDELEDKFQ